MSEPSVEYCIESISDLQRKIIAISSEGYAFQYAVLASRIGAPFDETKMACAGLKSLDLALIRPTMTAGLFSGSGLTLNARGLQVKKAILGRQ